MRSMIRVALVALAILLPAQAGSARDGASAVTGTAQLASGTWLRIDAQPAQSVWPYTIGKAWLMEVATSRAQLLEIELDCLQVAWHGSAYPFPPYTPYRVAMATGRAADGVRYYITAIDMAPSPLGFGDRLLAGTERGRGRCGAVDAIGDPIAAGDIVIA